MEQQAMLGQASTVFELGAAKIKLATILDQGDDSEIKPLTPQQLRVLIDAWKVNFNEGEDPSEEEEATGDQLSALAFRLRAGGTPFADFGVWRPHGADLGRALKFTAFVLCPTTGEHVRKEISGPAGMADWRKAWRVFAFAMEVLGAASRIRLKRYADQIQKLSEDYHELWWIIACADHKLRRLHLERIRRRLASEDAELRRAGMPSNFNPAAPWDMAFREAAKDTEFWAAEVDKKVVQFVTAQRSKAQLTDPGYGALRFEAKAGKRNRQADDDSSEDAAKQAAKKKSKKSKKQRDSAKGQAPKQGGNSGGAGKGKSKGTVSSDGRTYRLGDGKEVCWSWNKKLGGCSAVCPNGRAHVCECCLDTGHRSCEKAKCPKQR